MVGFRVFDVGLLIVWLVWFFRLRDDEDPSEDDGPGGGGGPQPKPRKGPGGGGLRMPIGWADQGRRLRDHARPAGWARKRGPEPLSPALPARIRQPQAPTPAHRR